MSTTLACPAHKTTIPTRRHARPITAWTREASAWLYTDQASHTRAHYDVGLCDTQALIWAAERAAVQLPDGRLLADPEHLLASQLRRGVHDTTAWTMLHAGGWWRLSETGALELTGPGWSSYGDRFGSTA